MKLLANFRILTLIIVFMAECVSYAGGIALPTRDLGVVEICYTSVYVSGLKPPTKSQLKRNSTHALKIIYLDSEDPEDQANALLRALSKSVISTESGRQWAWAFRFIDRGAMSEKVVFCDSMCEFGMIGGKVYRLAPELHDWVRMNLDKAFQLSREPHPEPISSRWRNKVGKTGSRETGSGGNGVRGKRGQGETGSGGNGGNGVRR